MAKQSLQFDPLLPASKVSRDKESDNPLKWAISGEMSSKSWYEQTLEEEENEAELEPLEARFFSSIKIGEANPVSDPVAVQEINSDNPMVTLIPPHRRK